VCANVASPATGDEVVEEDRWVGWVAVRELQQVAGRHTAVIIDDMVGMSGRRDSNPPQHTALRGAGFL
jgi:hypothetical protein